jgi:hypothetical protein
VRATAPLIEPPVGRDLVGPVNREVQFVERVETVRRGDAEGARRPSVAGDVAT